MSGAQTLPLPRAERAAGGRLRKAWALPKRVDPWLGAALLMMLVAVIVAAVVAIRDDAIFAYGDAGSHVLIARRIFDNQNVGLAQLGVHWAPLFQLLQVPFVAIGPLYRSGVSGTIVAGLGALATAFFVYRLAVLVGAVRWVGFLAVTMLVAAPSFLYVSVVPIHYTLVMATATGSVYFLTLWAINKRGGALLGAGIMLSLATLSHFDSWILWPLELAVVLLVCWRRRYHRTGVEATTLLWAVAASYGIVLFLLMNVMIYGDPLQFLHSFSSTAAQAGSASRGGAAAAAIGHQLGQVAGGAGSGIAGQDTYPRAVIVLAGLPLVLGAVIGAVLYVIRWWRDLPRLIPFLLFYPLLLYEVWQLVRPGIIKPGPYPELWENLRYASTIYPALAFFLAVGLRWTVLRLLAAGAVIAVGATAVISGDVAAFREANVALTGRIPLLTAADWFGEHSGGGTVLFPNQNAGKNGNWVDLFEIRSGVSGDTIVDRADGQLWRRAVKDPALVDTRWIAVVKGWNPPAKNAFLASAGDTALCYETVNKVVRIYALAGPGTPGVATAEDICRNAGGGNVLYKP